MDRGRVGAPSRRSALAVGTLGVTTLALPTAASAASPAAPASAPSAPTVTATAAGYLVTGGATDTGAVEVSWAAVGGATGYLVRTSPAGADTWSVGTSTTATRLLVSGLADGAFDVEVTASNAAGSSSPTVVNSVDSVIGTGGDVVATFVGDGNDGTVDGTRYVVHRFTSTGIGVGSSLILKRAVDLTALVVGGGGGGGGGHAGGGGGGGGVDERTILGVTGTVTVEVGAGGAPGDASASVGKGGDGAASTLSASDGTTSTTVTAGGGGGGAGFGTGGEAGAGTDGASGGGGSGNNGAAFRTGGGSAGGNVGGAGSGPVDDFTTGGGGGGAGGVGGDASYVVSASDGGSGGSGVPSSISGTAVQYGAGGGGGGWGATDTRWDSGRIGVGGRGGSSGAGGHGGPFTSTGEHITDQGDLALNSNDPRGGAGTTPGSGGGGCAARPYENVFGGHGRDGGAGADGVVILRYALPAA